MFLMQYQLLIFKLYQFPEYHLKKITVNHATKVETDCLKANEDFLVRYLHHNYQLLS